jgi:hypothetical protein
VKTDGRHLIAVQRDDLDQGRRARSSVSQEGARTWVRQTGARAPDSVRRVRGLAI